MSHITRRISLLVPLCVVGLLALAGCGDLITTDGSALDPGATAADVEESRGHGWAWGRDGGAEHERDDRDEWKGPDERDDDGDGWEDTEDDADDEDGWDADEDDSDADRLDEGDTSDPFDAAIEAGKANGLARFSHGAPVVPEIAVATIGPEGGTLALGPFEVVVPPGAVDRATLFQIRRPVDRASRDYVLAELKPQNVVFAVPVLVRMPLDGTDAEWAGGSVGRFEAETWTALPSDPVDDGAQTETEVESLSMFGLLRGELTSGG